VSTASWFDDVPEVYDRIRPLYPKRMYQDLFNYLGDDPAHPSSLATIEIGPGTGQATGALLERGATVAAVEPGTKLATYLRRKFPDEPRLVVINERFEDAPLPEGMADLVFAATSFHWIDPQVRYAKTLSVLRPGGTLAVVHPHQIASEVDRGYFAASQPIYDRYFPGEEPGELPDEEVTPPEIGEMIDTQRFERVELFRYRFDQRYETRQYIDLVRSYSGTNQMLPEARDAFLGELAEFIDSEFAGYVVRPLVLTLALGSKRPT
jgi:SAM-dependent methyltransferase